MDTPQDYSWVTIGIALGSFLATYVLLWFVLRVTTLGMDWKEPRTVTLPAPKDCRGPGAFRKSCRTTRRIPAHQIRS
jgi:hypothetical protein